MADACAMQAEEIEALQRLADIKPAFSVWSAGRREESEGRPRQRSRAEPVPQPALIYPGLPLYVGDADDAANIAHLTTLGIGCVVNLCASELTRSGYAHLPAELARAGIHQQILVADDACGFDIISVSRLAVGCIRATLGALAGRGVLVHCWGGVNQSAAVVVFYLVTECGVPLMTAVERMMQRRGTVLTNYSFRKQLVQHCFRHGLCLGQGQVPLDLLASGVPSDLMRARTERAWHRGHPSSSEHRRAWQQRSIPGWAERRR